MLKIGHKILFTIFLLLSALCVSGKNFTLVLDAGHGGKDYGAAGAHSYEKNINLAVVKKLGAIIEENCKDVDVVYTRTNDTYLTLKERAAVANKASGDLFISVHTNSIDKRNKRRKTINGAATYTLGLHKSDENLEVAIRENSVIELENDYTKTYKGFNPNSAESYIIFEISQQQHMTQSVAFASLVQSELHNTAGRKNNGVRQAGFWVLFATGMPAVLVELDFICNPTSEAFMTSSKGQEKLAKAIYNAFVKYKDSLDGKIELAAEKSDLESGSIEAKNKSEQIVYRVQYFTSGKKLSENSRALKGVKPDYIYYENKMYKYTVGNAGSVNEAIKILNDVRRKFDGAFIVKFRNNKRIK